MALAALVALAAVACSRPRPPPPQEIPEVPEFIDEYTESLFLRAHLNQLIRSLRADDDVVFERRDKVGKHLFWIMGVDLSRWDDNAEVGDLWMSRIVEQRLLEESRGASAYRGARQRAVVLGLLAQEIWRRNPPPYNPSEAELDLRAEIFGHGLWPVDAELDRAVALKRMILVGKYADGWLFRARSGPLGPGDWE